MTHRRLLLFISFLFASGCGTSSQVLDVRPEAVGLSSAKLRKVGEVMNGMVREGRIVGGLVMVAKNGRIAYVTTYGRIDRETGNPVRRDTIFRIYSMTKAIATAAALTLVEEGKLDLDAPVGKYVPELKELRVYTPEGLRPPKRPPTVKDLMLHTAGFRYGGGPPIVARAYQERQPLKAKDLEEMAQRLSAVPLAYQPGTDWVYSLSIDVVGLVIERASGTPLDRFLEERIFTPLGMHDTGFHVPPEKIDRFAGNYRREKEGLRLIDAPAESKYAKPATFFSGGGGLVSTADDYMRFLLMVEGGGQLQGVRILKPGTVKLMTTNQLPAEAFPIYFGKQIRHKTGFGLGFSVRTAASEWDPQARVGEYGWGGAASTHYWVSPNDRLIVVTMEQTMPYTFDTEWAVKGMIYDALMN